MNNTLSQDAIEINLVFIEDDPVSLGFYVEGANWAGTYTAQVRGRRNKTATLIATFGVTATYENPDTLFAITAGDTSALPTGTYYWDCQQTDGPTRFQGKVTVKPQITN